MFGGACSLDRAQHHRSDRRKPIEGWSFRSRALKLAGLILLAGISSSIAQPARAQTCGGAINNQIQQPAGTPNLGPFQVGDTVTVRARIINTNDEPFDVSNLKHDLSCFDTTDFTTCNTAPDDSVASFVGNVTTNCVDAGNHPVTWTTSISNNQVTFTPNNPPHLATSGNAGDRCDVSYDVQINGLSTDSTPSQIQWANRENGKCATSGIDGGADGSGIFSVLECKVELDKQVSCDGGNTFFDVSGADDTEPPSETLSDLCIGWNAFANGGATTPATSIIVRYAARNVGSVDATCSTSNAYGTDGTQGLFDSNLGILPSGVSVSSIPATQTSYVQVGQETVACSDTLAGGEPDTGSLLCQCQSGGKTFLAPVSNDSAKFACETPGLAVTKSCGPVDSSGNAAVSVTYQSNGSAALDNCALTDTVYAGACVNGAPSSTTVVGSVTGIPSQLTDPTANPTTIDGLTATGLNTTSCDGSDCCNQVSITCQVAGSPGPETITRSNVADCAIASGDCFTRTGGYWGNHPKAQNLLYKTLGSVFSCGVDLDLTAASTQGSGTEDICSIGGGSHNPPQTSISNTQRQLERQCAVANLNLAASQFLEVSCEGVYPGIDTLVARCCNNPDSVCNAGGDTAGCIGALDVFNNTDFTTIVGPSSVDATNIVSGPANPTQCQASKASGFVNHRPRP